MEPEIRHYAVNWQGGMKVSYRHFIAFEDYLSQNIQDANRLHLNSSNYGLLPPRLESRSSLEWHCELIAGNQIKVVITACRIVTAGGIFIERSEQENSISGLGWIDCLYSLKDESIKCLDVVLGIDLGSRIPIGDPDPVEEPVRRPFADARIQVLVRPGGSPSSKMSELKIGEILVDGGKIAKSDSFIPPCVSIKSCILLQNKYDRFKEYLIKIEEGSVAEVQMLKMKYAQDQFTHENLQYLSNGVVGYLSNTIERYNRILPDASPLHFVEYFCSMARVVDTSLRCMNPETKNSLLSTFMNVIVGFTLANFQDSLTRLMTLTYDQLRISDATEIIERFLKELARLYDALPKLRDFYLEPPI